MSSGQAGDFIGIQDGQPSDHTSPHPPQQEHQQQRQGEEQEGAHPGSWTLDADPIQVDDDSFLSPEVRLLLQRGAETTGLEVDEADDEAGADEEEDHAPSVYAMSMYPNIQPAYQVEHPYESGQDSATMYVAPSPVIPTKQC
jgi:hypothetical protein